jgi:hypothetical protein
LAEFKVAQKLCSISSIFGIQALDHAPHGCCLISTSHSRYPCYSSQAVLRKHSHTSAVLRTFVFKSFRMLWTICCTKQFTLLQMTPLLANIFDQDHRILRTLSPSRFIAIVLRAISSPCHRYRYPPRSTEPIPLVLHHDVLQILPLHRCHLSLSSYPLAHPVAVHLLRRRPLHLRHESQHRSLTGVRPLERAYCHER